jgi:hypothetical protein
MVKNEIQTPEKMMVIPINFLLWDYLLKGKKQPSKFTRCEAFFDLIKRQSAVMDQIGEIYINGSLRELALAWHWDRETVSRFLSQLAMLGILLVHNDEHRTSYSLRCSLETLEPQREPSKLVDWQPSRGRPSGT